MSDSDDIIDMLVTEHRTIEGLFADVETTTDRALRRDVLEAAIASLREHAEREERYLYPMTRARLPAGEALADHEMRAHVDADRIITRLSGLDDSDPDFDPLLTTMMAGIRHHVQEEETEIFPRLRNACPPETLRALGEDARRPARPSGTGTAA